MDKWTFEDQQNWEKEFQKRFGFTYDQFKKAFAVRFGVPIEHAKIHSGDWTVSKWKEDDLDSQGIKYGKDGNFIQVLEKLQIEVKNNPRTTIPQLQYYHNPNILLLTGLTESIKRDTNEVTSTPPSGLVGISHIGVGTDGTSESESQSGLIAAYGSRKEFDVTGQRKAVNQIGKYNMVFRDTDLTVPVTLKEAATYNLLTGGIAHARLQYPDFLMTSGQVITFQINESQANG